MLEPMGAIIDAGGAWLGLPSSVRNAAKLVAGLYTGNFVCAISGGVGLVGDLSKEAQKTEYVPSKSATSIQGYAATASRSAASTASPADPSLGELDRNLAVVEKYFDTFARPTAFDMMGLKDTFISKDDLLMIANSSKVTDEVRGAAVWLLSHRDEFAQVDGASTQRFDGHLSLDDVRAMREQLRAQSQTTPGPVCGGTPQPSEPPSVCPSRASAEPVLNTAPLPPGVTTRSDSPLAHDILEYREVLQMLKANWNTFDSAVGRLDEYLTRENLQAIASNPNADPKLKHVATFLLDHPEYFNRLEMAAHIGGKDGIVGLGDVLHEIARVDKDLATYGAPSPAPSPSSPSSPSTPSSSAPVPPGGVGCGGTVGSVGGSPGSVGPSSARSDIQSILNDPSLSLEEKIQLILMKIAEGEDDEILAVMGEMGTSSQKLAELRATTKADDKDGQKQLAKQQQNQELLQQRLQKAMERRKQMYDLMSNMSSKFNEMAKTAIGNMARA